MTDQEILGNIQGLANVMEQNMALMTQRLNAIMEVLEDIQPGSTETYHKRMFGNKVMGLHLALEQAREAGRLDIIEANNNVLTLMKKQAKKAGWYQVYLHAVREANHLLEKPEPSKEDIIEMPE